MIRIRGIEAKLLFIHRIRIELSQTSIRFHADPKAKRSVAVVGEVAGLQRPAPAIALAMSDT